MLFDPNIDTLEDVLQIRAKALEALKEGASVLSWSSEGTSVTKSFTLPVKTVLQETLLYLKKTDPDLYGPIITRTRANFI